MYYLCRFLSSHLLPGGILVSNFGVSQIYAVKEWQGMAARRARFRFSTPVNFGFIYGEPSWREQMEMKRASIDLIT